MCSSDLVTSPHTIPQRASFPSPCHRSLSIATYPISPRSSLDLPPSLPLFLRVRALLLPRNVPPTWRFFVVFAPSPYVYPLDFSLSRPLLSMSSSSIIILVFPVYVVLLTLCLRFFPLIVHPRGRHFLTLRYSRFPAEFLPFLPFPRYFLMFLQSLVHAFLLGLNYA